MKATRQPMVEKNLQCFLLRGVKAVATWQSGESIDRVHGQSSGVVVFLLNASKAFSLSNRCLRGCLKIFILRRSMIQQSLQYLVFSKLVGVHQLYRAGHEQRGNLMQNLTGASLPRYKFQSRLHEGMRADKIEGRVRWFWT